MIAATPTPREALAQAHPEWGRLVAAEKEKAMRRRVSVELKLDRTQEHRVSRRAFGRLALGGLACAGLRCTTMTQGDSAVTRAEREGPDHLPRRRVKVLDTEISYVDIGAGEPVAFLHGNPTWSYQWRNIIPSSQPPPPVPRARHGGHGLVRHVADPGLPLRRSRAISGCVVRGVAAHEERHLDGAGLGLGHRARRYPGQVKAIAYYEAIVLPRRWEDFSGGRDKLFRALRGPEGERLVMDEDIFVEVVLPRGILRKLSDEEMEAYRAPYRDRDKRLPTLIWPRELPIDGVPADVVAIVEQNATRG